MQVVATLQRPCKVPVGSSLGEADVVEVRILGPVEAVDVDGRERKVGGPRPATILLTLALAGGAVVSSERLLRELWGAEPPPTALETLHSHLSRLRRALEPRRVAHAATSVVLRETGGYRLAGGVTVDARVFESELVAAREGLGQTPADAALERLCAALALWRGDVGEGLELRAGNRAEARRLEELRLAALEARFAAELELGRHTEVAIDLEVLVAAHPHREHLHGLLMLALYRCGRQAEALAAYRGVRQQLVEHLGVEPSRQLTVLHDRILAHDPVLELSGAPPPAGRPSAAHGVTEDEREAGSRELGNLPASLVDLVGRDGERQAVAEALGPHRLVTLTGAGGCGKTQLALAIAHHVAGRYTDGAWWVDLQSREDPALVVGAVATALGVDDAPPGALEDGLVARLRDRRVLLVLDNCEHVIDGCAHVVRELLVRCPQLDVLATSRQPLDLDGERVWRVPSLTVPPPGADLAAVLASDAGRLLVRLGTAARDGFTPGPQDAPALTAVCRELDGIPLALELAAARLRVLSIGELAERLDDRFAVLRSSRREAPPRHRTLDAAIGWSFDLLDEPAQRLLCRLSVFRSGASLEAVEAVCADELLPHERILPLLEELVDRSLVTTSPRAVGPASHDLLQSIRSFAAARLGAAERSSLRHRHAAWYAGLAERGAEQLTGPDQVRWLNRLHAEHEELRAALAWSLEHGAPVLAARVCGGIWWFWLQFGHAREGAAWLDRVLTTLGAQDAPLQGRASDAEGAVGPDLVQRLSYAAGRLAAAIGAAEQARGHLERGAQLARALDAPCRVALCEARLLQLEPDGSVTTTGAAGPTAVPVGAGGCDDRWVRAAVSDAVGHLAAGSGDLDAAMAAFRASEEGYLEVEDRWSACIARLGRAWVARRRGCWSEALELHLENIDAARTLTRSAYDFIGLARDLRGIGAAASALDAHGAAARLCGASENLRSLGEVALAPEERVEVEQVLAGARSALGPGPAGEEQAAGRSLRADEALALATEVAAELLAGIRRREVMV